MKITWIYEKALAASSAYMQQMTLFSDRLHSYGIESLVACAEPFKHTKGTSEEDFATFLRNSHTDLFVAVGDVHPYGLELDMQTPMLSWFVWGEDKPILVPDSPLITYAPVSRFAERLFSPELPSVRYVPHGFSADAFHPGRRATARARIGLPQDRPIVAAVSTNLTQGEHEPGPDRKNWMGILEAFAELLQTTPDALLYCHANAHGGTDLARWSIALGIGDSVVFGDQERLWETVRHFDASEVADVYRAANVLLMPSLGEGFGIPLIEAQACGVPVVTTQAGPMTELAITGTAVAGRPHPKKPEWAIPDRSELAKALAYWIDNQVDPYETAAHIEQFSADAVVEEHFLPAIEEALSLAPRKSFPAPIKLDIGSGLMGLLGDLGPDGVGGWSTVDKFVAADIQADMWDLPIPDNSIEEIASTHCLEHCEKTLIQPTLREWYRVLKPGAKATISVPNLDYVARNWLKNGTNEEYALMMVFGSQAHAGEFHKTGWNIETFQRELEATGFKVTYIESLWGGTYTQETIQAVVRKPDEV